MASIMFIPSKELQKMVYFIVLAFSSYSDAKKFVGLPKLMLFIFLNQVKMCLKKYHLMLLLWVVLHSDNSVNEDDTNYDPDYNPDSEHNKES